MFWRPRDNFFKFGIWNTDAIDFLDSPQSETIAPLDQIPNPNYTPSLRPNVKFSAIPNNGSDLALPSLCYGVSEGKWLVISAKYRSGSNLHFSVPDLNLLNWKQTAE